MRSYIRAAILLLFPFLLMVIVNELLRPEKPNPGYLFKGRTSAMHSGKADVNRCTWRCHNDTRYCLNHHLSLFKSYDKFISPIYFYVINRLKGTGQYELANILLFVVLIPGGTLLLIIGSLHLQDKIVKQKRGYESVN